MAYTRVSAHDVARVCEKYQKLYDTIVKLRLKQRKERLVKRLLFPLTEINANKKIKLEEELIEDSVAEELGEDYQIYWQLNEICRIARAGDFITIDSIEAEFINRLRK